MQIMQAIDKMKANLEDTKQDQSQQQITSSTKSLQQSSKNEYGLVIYDEKKIKSLTIHLFKYFTVCWGAKWTNYYAQNSNISSLIDSEWGKLLSTLTIEQIRQGIDYHKKNNEWFPSLAEFRKSALNILPPEQAWILARNENCNNEIIKKVKNSIQSWDWEHKEEKDLRREFINSYNLIVESL